MAKKLFLSVPIVLFLSFGNAIDYSITVSEFQNALTETLPFEKFDREVIVGTSVQGFKYKAHEILVNESGNKIDKVLYQSNIKRFETEEDRLMFFYTVVSLFSKKTKEEKKEIGSAVTELFDKTMKELKSKQQKANAKVKNFVSVNKSKKLRNVRFDMFMSATGTFNLTVDLN